jgi:predicted MFS family arabinose efflux permease
MRQKHWLVITLAGSLTLCLALGVRQGFGLFLNPITTDLGISRGSFALAMATQNLLWGGVQPFVGMIADRYGSGRVLVFGAVLYILGLLTMSGGSPITLNLGAGPLVGLGLSGVSFAVVLGGVGRLVIPEKRMTALALASAGGSLGQFVMIPAVQGLLATLGWQQALVALALFIVPMFLLATQLRGKAAVTTDGSSPLQALKGAFGHRGYVLLTLGFLVCGFHVVFIAIHLPAYLVDLGFSASLGAKALTLIGFFNIFGTYVWGQVGGKYRKKSMLSLLYALRAVTLAWFIFLPKSELTVLFFSGSMGALWLGTVPLTSGLVGDIFGVRYVSTLFGMVFLGHQIGAFCGAWLGGFVFDRTGSYNAVWLTALGLSLVAMVIHLVLPDRRYRPQLG